MSFMATVIQKQSNVSSRSGFSLLPHICMWVSRLKNLVIIVKEGFYVPRLHCATVKDCVASLMQNTTTCQILISTCRGLKRGHLSLSVASNGGHDANNFLRIKADRMIFAFRFWCQVKISGFIRDCRWSAVVQSWWVGAAAAWHPER